MSDIGGTLAERYEQYGDFTDQAVITQAIKGALRGGASWARLRPYQREALEMIASKMARAVNGDPTHFDTWHDMAGYATLVTDRLERAA